MKDEERRLFEKEIELDPNLAMLVEEIRNLQDLAARAIQGGEDPEEALDENVRQEIRSMVKEFREGKQEGDPGQVKEAAESYFAKQTSASRNMLRAWYAIAAVIIAGGILSVILLQPFTRTDPAGIYARYAGTFPRTEDIMELTRSNDDFMFAIEVFESKDYERASVLFRMLADSAGTREFALLYLGHSYMGLNRSDLAIEAYTQLIDSASGALPGEAKWYMALCYLKKEKTSEAVALLKEISGSASPYRSEARKILRSLR